ncbi:hypothetical protein Q1695_002585 [Nippostrongylus brasiliensis]|nr:hypothetical protein Q1695_002585 [Nippostrongylus brasiliensis]
MCAGRDHTRNTAHLTSCFEWSVAVILSVVVMCSWVHLPDDLLLLILKQLDGRDVRSLGNTCQRFRHFIIRNDSKLSKPELTCEEAHIAFNRKVTVTLIFRNEVSCVSATRRKRRRDSYKENERQLTMDEFSDFTGLFFLIAPRVLFIKCSDLDERIMKPIMRRVGRLQGKTLALEMDKCTHFSPFALHLTGHFDRSIISDRVLPLSTLNSLFIGVNRAHFDQRTTVSGITVRKIVNNWFQRYGKYRDDAFEYHGKDFEITIPDCDLDYNEFFALLRELLSEPHGTKERINIFNLPSSLILAVYRSVLTFNSLGPALWVEQGLCDANDVSWSNTLTCMCGRCHHEDFAPENLASPSCDNLQLVTTITVLKCRDGETFSSESLLNLQVALTSAPLLAGKTYPKSGDSGQSDSCQTSEDEQHIAAMWDWQSFFVKIGIPTSVSSRYAEIFRQNRVSKDMLPDLDKSTLADLGVTAVGDQLAILKHGKEVKYEVEGDSPSKIRVRIPGPGARTEDSSNGSSSASELRRGRVAPDRHDIYHIKMPEGLTVRGTTGVRQGGRSVSPIDKKSAAVVRMRQEQYEANDPIISRLGVRGLHSDASSRAISGRVQKRSAQKPVVKPSRLRDVPYGGDNLAIKVQIPSGSRLERRIAGQPRSKLASSLSNRVSRGEGNGLPRVTVKLRGGAAPSERVLLKNPRYTRKPVHARLSTATGGGKVIRTTRIAPRPSMRRDYVVEEDEMLDEEEEYLDEEMVWDGEDDVEDEELDQYEEVEYVEDRPSVYNRLSRVPSHSFR